VRVALLTREFPPEVYGGAGVHVEYLAAELAPLVDLDVHAFGKPRPSQLVAATYEPWDRLVDPDRSHASALATLSVDLEMALGVGDADLVHTHTWYANMGGHLASLLYGIPHVMTAHSLEPLRPWKAEQLGGGYAVSSWCERTAVEAADAVIAVSGAMRDDILRCYPGVDPARVHVIHNGIDVTQYQRDDATDVLERLGIDPTAPYAFFVGRMTRQKGIVHLLDAAAHMDPSHTLVVLASSPDTAEIGQELRARAGEIAASASGARLVFVEETPPRSDVIQLFSHATVFVCPSIYEPFGLVNIEAMACETPVVASAVGGIPEIVVDGETGVLVDVGEADANGTPVDRDAFARRIAAAVGRLLDDPDLAARMGAAGHARVHERFTWPAIARRTVDLYEAVTAARSA
jgi:alpha-maltose-1-phosphate synthase